MRVRILIVALLYFIQGFGQELALKEAQIRDKDNTYLLSSAPFVDNNRFVWYATNRDGDFYRFDGKNKLRYRFHKDKDNYYDSFYISSHAWIQDSNNTIWAAELNKAYLITPDKLQVECIQYPTEGLRIKSAIAKDKANNLWISNGSRFLIKITPDRQVTQVTHPILENKKESFDIMKTLEDGRIIAKSGFRLFYIDAKGLHFFGDLKAIDKDINYDFALFENGKIVAKNTSGYYKYNATAYKYIYLKGLDLQLFNYSYGDGDCYLGNCDWSNNTLIADSKLFIADDSNLFVNEIDKNTNEIRTIDTLHFKKPISIASNKHHPNFIWISTYDELYKLLVTPSHFERILQFNNRQLSTRGIVADSKNNLYIGTYEGLYTQENGHKKAKEVVVKGEKNGVYDILFLEKNDSILWATEGYNWIKRVNLNTHTKKEFEQTDGLAIQCLKEKSSDAFWLGTDQGLFVFDKKTGKTSPYVEDGYFLGNTSVFGFIEARNGKKWIATRQGLFVKEKGKDFINYHTLNPSFDYKNLLVLHEDEKGNLWMGTDGKGIVFLDPKTNRFKNLTQSNGLSNNIVCGIIESKDALWFSTYYGLSRFDKQKAFFTVYYKEDGLSENEFNVRSSYKKNNNSFYFGGLNGIVEFNPEKIEISSKHPHTLFLYSSSYFSKDKNKNITDYLNLDQQTISLPYNKNYFSAIFSINELFFIEKNSYLYKIEGLREEWIDAGTSGSIELPSLPPGNYVLRVKGKDAKGIETANEIKIRLHVEQLFYKTPLFMGLALLSVLALVIYLFIRRSKKQKRIFEREKEIIELKASALKAQMNPHFVFNILNNMQSVLILKGEREVNKYFGAFSKLLRLTLDMSKQELVTLNDEIDYITNYLLLNKMQLNDELDYSIVVEDSIKNTSDIALAGMLIQPFVENAILHGLSRKKDRKLVLHFTIQDHYLIVTIEDNGIGRAAAALLSKNKTETHKSWATTIVNERIKIMNDSYKDSVSLEIIDLEKEGVPSGTKVVIRLKIN
ncbi:YXYXY domain-containing protein [Flavobacterium endophyticum]|uniref:YXYXY domain-containing protein n=1 Tax=Flavobacterium endophyticum TaxID=1540163 RepID=A0A495MLX3_9FLAO|nr:sensor histidine kinase [Flavobacterium endophyticum]RKS26052.1 YXYXY domain-containing protein [Flavobacterium endophyticum]